MFALHLIEQDLRRSEPTSATRVIAVSTNLDTLKEAAARDCNAAEREVVLEWEMDKHGYHYADFMEAYLYVITPNVEVL